MSSQFGEIMQLGYIVEDIDASAREWTARVGAGPFYLIDSMVFDQYYYRGIRTDLEMRIALGYWNNMQIELIQPLSDTDTLYNRALRSSPGRLNHCATVVGDVDALLERHQLQERVIHSGKMPTGVKFVYLEEYLPGSLHLELIEAQQDTLMAFAGMEKASLQWDGEGPVRPIARLQDDLAALR
jgi:methylmalonyl-CoA/ethylmalonyl-CoA epimerase